MPGPTINATSNIETFGLTNSLYLLDKFVRYHPIKFRRLVHSVRPSSAPSHPLIRSGRSPFSACRDRAGTEKEQAADNNNSVEKANI